MELGTAIIALAVLLACIIPFVLISRSNKKKQTQLLQVLSNLSETSHCKIVQYDVWNNAAIGIDGDFNKIFFYKKTEDFETHRHINLPEVEKCTLIDSYRTISSQSGDLRVFDKIELAFKYKDKNIPEASLVFYDADTDSLTLSGELRLAKKWCKIATDQIESLTHQR